MTWNQLALTVGTMLAVSAGQVLFKLASRRLTGEAHWLEELVFNPWLFVALVIYGGATLSWLALLRQVPLTVAYPFAALAFFLVPVLSHWWLDEALRWQTLLGATFILAGVWISVGWK